MTTITELPTGTWMLDPSATTITVSAKKLGLFTVPATLTVLSGTIVVGDDHDVSSVEIVADASSYSSKNAKRNEHIVSSDFLDAEAHPTIVFRADRVALSGGGLAAKGTITIKGQSSTIDVTISNVDVSEASGTFVATAAVDRHNIGVAKMPTVIIGRELGITVNATARKTMGENSTGVTG